MANIVFKIGNNTPIADTANIRNNQPFLERGKEWTYADVNLRSRFAGADAVDPRKPHFRISRNEDVDAVKGCIRNIFTWTPGERILDPEFGNRVRFYLYEQMTTYDEEAVIAEIRKAIAKYEPRARLDAIERVGDINDKENNTVRLKVTYHVLGLPQNQTYEEVIGGTE